MFERIIEKIVRWLIKKYLPKYHLHKDPVRKPNIFPSISKMEKKDPFGIDRAYLRGIENIYGDQLEK